MTTVKVRSRKSDVFLYSALVVGITCFVLTFVFPIVMNGSGGDPLVFILTAIGVLLAILAIIKSNKRFLPIVALILTLSFPAQILLWVVALFTGVMDFGT